MSATDNVVVHFDPSDGKLKSFLMEEDGQVFFTYIGDIDRDARLETAASVKGWSIIDDGDEERMLPRWYRSVDLVLLRERIVQMLDDHREYDLRDWFPAPMMEENL